jgi:hypothetical protein
VAFTIFAVVAAAAHALRSRFNLKCFTGPNGRNRMPSHPLIRSFAAGCAVFTLSLIARAAPVAPGGTVTNSSDQFAVPAGDVVDEITRPVTFNFTTQDPTRPLDPSEESVTGTFTSRVLRDAGTQQLTFLYDFQAERSGGQGVPPGNEGATLVVSSFGGFTTDVLGRSSNSEITIQRGASGAEITLTATNPGLAGPPALLVATDALNFNRNGSVVVTLVDEFAQGQRGDASLTLDAMFQPAAQTTTPIPLPSGAWAGLATLGLIGAVGRVRRMRTFS